MSRVPITDLNDARIAIYRSLKATNQTRRLGQFVVEGEEARRSPARQPVPGRVGTGHRSPRVQARHPDTGRCPDLCCAA